MTWSQGVDSANKYWRMLGTVVTVAGMVGGGLYAAGRNTEKFTTSQESLRREVVGVKTSVTKIIESDLPAITVSIKDNTVTNKDLKNEVALVTERVKYDQSSLIVVNKEVQNIKEQLSSMKTQQKTDSDWIKSALLRIESKQ